MKTTLRMNFDDFVKVQIDNNHIRYLNGDLKYDLGCLMERMAYELLPDGLPRNYFYDVEYNDRGSARLIKLCYIDKGFSTTRAWLDLDTGKLRVYGNNKMTNDYFVKPFTEIISLFHKYYKEHHIQSWDITKVRIDD